MKYQITFDGLTIQCDAASHVAALVKELNLARRARLNGGPHGGDAESASLFDAITNLGPGGRRFTKALVDHPDGLSAEKLSVALGFKKPTDIEGSVSAVKGFLKRHNIAFSQVFEETKNSKGERFLKIRPALFVLIKKASETIQ